MCPGTGSKPTADPSPPPDSPPSGSSRLRVAIGIVGALLAIGIIVAVILPRASEVGDALDRVGIGRFLLVVLLGSVSMIFRTAAWQVAIDSAGGRVTAHEAHPASGASFVVGLISPYLGVATRIAVIRHRVPDRSPTTYEQIAAESALLVVEAALVGVLLLIASWTLEIPFPVALAISLGGLLAAALLVVAARRLAPGRFGAGLAVARQPRALALVAGALACTLLLQMARVAVALDSVGLDTSLLVIVAVFLASGLGAILPIGTAAAGAAAPLIAVSGDNSVADATAAGVLLSGALMISTVGYFGVATWLAALSDRKAIRKSGSGRPPRTSRD
jgi:uncharacterized membrane protein YbhN (UPF0104 family)